MKDDEVPIQGDRKTNMIRPATIHDVPRIQEIINSHAELGKMLFKSLAQIYESLRDFAVYEIDAEIGTTAVVTPGEWSDARPFR